MEHQDQELIVRWLPVNIVLGAHTHPGRGLHQIETVHQCQQPRVDRQVELEFSGFH